MVVLLLLRNRARFSIEEGRKKVPRKNKNKNCSINHQAPSVASAEGIQLSWSDLLLGSR